MKIRLTDSVTIKQYSILKPEVEHEFPTTVPTLEALTATQALLDETVDFQLNVIVDRMTPKDIHKTLQDASIDKRFRTKLETAIK